MASEKRDDGGAYANWRFLVWTEARTLSYNDIDRLVTSGHAMVGDSAEEVMAARRDEAVAEKRRRES